MSETINASGSCLCGAVTINAESLSTSVGACHCGTCRKWGGGPFMALDCGTAVSFTGEDSIATFDSSEWADRGFCKQCGTHLFYRIKQTGQVIATAGLFTEDDRLLFDHQVFIDEKPAYYGFANKTEDMTGPEVFAKFGGG